MNIIKYSNLKGMNIETRGGTHLGILHDLELDKNSLHCVNILVAPSGLIKKIIGSDLIISSEDIIEVTDDKIIVSDNVAKETGSKVIVEDLSSNPSAQVVNSDN